MISDLPAYLVGIVITGITGWPHWYYNSDLSLGLSLRREAVHCGV